MLTCLCVCARVCLGEPTQAFQTCHLQLQLHTSEWFTTPSLLSHPSTGAHTHFNMDSTPSLQAIRKFIVREVAADWSSVAIYLGLESSVIRMARADHPQQCEHACTDIFERWLSWEPGTGERERTWRTVLSAVEEVGHKAFSQRLQTKVFHLQ